MVAPLRARCVLIVVSFFVMIWDVVAVATLPIGKETLFKGSFGETWVRLICHAAGCSSAMPNPDVNGADWLLADHGSEVVRVQVKTTEHPETTADSFTFDLDIPTYDKLRQGTTPGYLLLVVLTDVHPNWTEHPDGHAIVRAGIYWAALAGQPEVPNGATIAIHLPFTNKLTPAGVLDLFPSEP